MSSMVDTPMSRLLGRYLDLAAFRHSLISANLANLDTPGFSRQRPVLEETAPVFQGSLLFGTGVDLRHVQSLRNNVLELRLNDETQQNSQLGTFLNAMDQVQTLFSGKPGEIGDQITKFFSSISQLSTDPASMPLRQGVLTAAQNLAATFNNTANKLVGLQSNLDLGVGEAVKAVNSLSRQIAALNPQITAVQNLGQDAGVLVDQRNQLIRQLSTFVNVSVIPSDTGISVTTSNGTALVAGSQSFDLGTQPGAGGLTRVLAQGTDITATLNGGELGGILEVRDQQVPTVLSQLDALAGSLAIALNTANQAGLDLSGNRGGNLFVPPAAGNVGAAANLKVAITDPALIAASSDGSPGSNGNLANLSAVSTTALASLGGQNPADFYSNVAFGVGSVVSNSSSELNASTLLLQQLQNQRGAISGVSLDEEAANLIQFQRSFQAAARVVDVINQMTGVAVNLGIPQGV